MKIDIEKLKKFEKLPPDVKRELSLVMAKWKEKKKQADIKNDFNSVDYVGNNRYVFNIKGNKYRLVVIIIFISKKVYIRFIGTHSEYDKIDCKNI